MALFGTQPLIEAVIDNMDRIDDVDAVLTASVGSDGPVPAHLYALMRDKLATVESNEEFKKWCLKFMRRQKGIDQFILSVFQQRYENAVERVGWLDVLKNEYKQLNPDLPFLAEAQLKQWIEFLGYNIPWASREIVNLPANGLTSLIGISTGFGSQWGFVYGVGIIQDLIIRDQRVGLSPDEFLFFTAFASAKDIQSLSEKTLNTMRAWIENHPGRGAESAPGDKYQYLALRDSLAKVNLLHSAADNDLSVELNPFFNAGQYNEIALANVRPYFQLPFNAFGEHELNVIHLDLPRAQWGRLDLSRSKIVNANLIASQLSDGSMCGARLTEVNLSDSVINQANWSKSIVKNVDFSRASLIGTRFKEAIAMGLVNFKEAKLNAANFTSLFCLNGCKIDFDNASLKQATLNGANFSKLRDQSENGNQVNFSGANFDRAFLHDVWLEGPHVNLENAQLYRVDARDAHFKQANLKNTNWKNAYLPGADFRDADLSGAVLIGADLTDTVFTNAKLVGASFLDLSPMMSEVESAYIDVTRNLRSELDRLQSMCNKEQLKAIEMAVAQQIISTVMAKENWDNDSKLDYIQQAFDHEFFKPKGILNALLAQSMRMFGGVIDQDGLTGCQRCMREAMVELGGDYREPVPVSGF